MLALRAIELMLMCELYFASEVSEIPLILNEKSVQTASCR